MLHTLFSTDFRYIIFVLVMLIVLVMSAATYDSVMVHKNTRKYNQPKQGFMLYDYTFLSDQGEVFVVTALDPVEAQQLLHEDHGISNYYINHNLFLAHVEKAI